MTSCSLRTSHGTRTSQTSPSVVREYSSSPATRRPHPVIQSNVMDEDGNLRTTDIGITWAGNETFLHGVRVVGPGPTRPAGMGPVNAISTVTRTRPGVFAHNDTTTDTVITINSLWTRRFSNAIPHTRYVRGIDRLPPFKDSTTNPSTGRRGFVISGRLLTSMAGAKTRERYNWCPTSTKPP